MSESIISSLIIGSCLVLVSIVITVGILIYNYQDHKYDIISTRIRFSKELSDDSHKENQKIDD